MNPTQPAMTPEQVATLDQLDTVLDEPDESIEEVVDPNASPLDDLDDDEPIFAGGPTKADVKLLKEKYPDSSIMALLLADGQGILYRTVTRNDWKAITKLTKAIDNAETREEVIFAKIVLFPDCTDQSVVGRLPAGAIVSVMQEFYVYSGFQPVAASMKL